MTNPLQMADNFLSDLKLGQKLIIPLLIMAILVALTGIFSIRNITRLADSTVQIASISQPQQQRAMLLNAGNEAARIKQTAKLTLVTLIGLAMVLALLLGKLAARDIVGRISRMGQALAQGANGDLTTNVTVISHDELSSLNADFNAMTERLSGMIGRIKKSIDELGEASRSISQEAGRSFEAAESQSEGINQTSTAIIEINSSINSVAQSMDSLSLSASESSAATLEMVTSLEEVAQNMERLAWTVEGVSSSITEMAISVKQIDSSVVSVVDASTTTASSVASLDNSISRIKKNAADTAIITNEVLRDAESGKLSVEATITGIKAIRRSSDTTASVMATLNERTNMIGSILSVIDEVAQQTNLLALNAAIIAAQAGEHGKGFAVVAKEIKDLADRTRTSTREITDVIQGVQEETLRAVKSIKDAEKIIAEGEILSKRSGEALSKIVAGAKEATVHMGTVAQDSEVQARESQQIREAMNQVADTISQIAKATKEQGRASELIMTAVEDMKELNDQVRLATKEQSSSGNLIGQSTEKITEMIDQIKVSCYEQSRGSDQIVQALGDIQCSTEINLETTHIIAEFVQRLTQQTELLGQEMNNFKVK